MNCTIQLSKMHFEQRDQFEVKKSVSTSQMQPNQKDANNQDQSTVRTQPKRAAKSVKRNETNSCVAKISSKCTSIGKTITSKQQSKSLCKSSHSNKNVLIEVGQLVLAKQKYSVPWPSQILTVKKDSVHVYFFGDERCGLVQKCDLFSIADSRDIIINCLNRKNEIADYRKGIIQMERILGVPDSLSITNMN